MPKTSCLHWDPASKEHSNLVMILCFLLHQCQLQSGHADGENAYTHDLVLEQLFSISSTRFLCRRVNGRFTSLPEQLPSCVFDT